MGACGSNGCHMPDTESDNKSTALKQESQRAGNEL